jgi:two-component system NarL family sensor kinase
MASSEIPDFVISIVVVSMLFFLLSAFFIAFAALFYRKKQQHKLEKQQLQSQFSQILLQAQLEIQEHTLKQVAYELHDNLGQIASLIKINLNTLRLDDKVETNLKIEDTKDLVRRLISDLKSISVGLNSDRIGNVGLVNSLIAEADRLNKIGVFEASVVHEDKHLGIDPKTEIILYRMSQEILNNIVKHSAAKRITISVHSTENLLKLAFTDDGIGFDVGKAATNGGSGLMNLKSRAQLIRADIKIISTPGSGSSVVIESPL